MRTRLLLALLIALVAAGCGDDGEQPADLRGREGAQSGGEDLAHIHGFGVSGGTLYIATHFGLWTVPNGELKARRFGDSRQDIMGFSVVGDDHFIGSGHPDPADSSQPPNLGLIESRDGGRTWKSISLLGEADFHVLESAGRHVYGVSSADGRLMVSDDRGRSWAKRDPPAGVFGLAADPREQQRIVISTEQGLYASADAGRRWRPLRDDVGGLLAWPRSDELYLLGGDGGVRVSADGGREWKSLGNVDGEPAAFIADGDELYASLHDGSVKVSTDGGATWTTRATP